MGEVNVIDEKNKDDKCTDKEWTHCRVEKRGCEGCHYDIEYKKKKRSINNGKFREENK